jgi:MoaA/NifB/PqqE/SkfB family radical SAM enzyme
MFKEEPLYFFIQTIFHILQKINLFISRKYPSYSFVLRKLWIPLTYRCNLCCSMCGQWGKKGRSKDFLPSQLQEEISLSKWKKLIKQIFIFQPRVMFVGGEPFLYDGWYELGKYIKKYFLRLEATTNGILLAENAKKVFSIFDSLNISLDGPPDISNKIRGFKGGFEKAIRGIRMINKLKKKYKKKKPYINICCTITEENYFALKEFVLFLEKQNIEIDLLLFQHLEFVPEDMLRDNKKVWEKEFNASGEYWESVCYSIKKINPNKLIEEIKEVKNLNLKNIKYVFFEPDFNEEEVLLFYSGKFLHRFKERCNSPWLEAFVYPEGNVWTCLGMIMGNINTKETSFFKIWNGEKYKKVRNFLNKNNFFPICSHCANHWHNWNV